MTYHTYKTLRIKRSFQSNLLCQTYSKSAKNEHLIIACTERSRKSLLASFLMIPKHFRCTSQSSCNSHYHPELPNPMHQSSFFNFHHLLLCFPFTGFLFLISILETTIQCYSHINFQSSMSFRLHLVHTVVHTGLIHLPVPPSCNVFKKSMSILYAKSTTICTSLLNTIPTPPHHLYYLHLHVFWSQLHSALFPLGTFSTTFKTRHNCKQLFTVITLRSVVSHSLLKLTLSAWGSPYKFKGAGRVWRSGVKGNFVRRRGGLAPANFAG